MGKRTEKATLLSAANQGILRVARQISWLEREWEEVQEWEFFCECGRTGCADFVFLTLAAYAAAHDGGRAVLADGHAARA